MVSVVTCLITDMVVELFNGRRSGKNREHEMLRCLIVQTVGMTVSQRSRLDVVVRVDLGQ